MGALLRGQTFLRACLLPARLQLLPEHRPGAASIALFLKMSADSGAPVVERARTIAGQTLVGGMAGAVLGSAKAFLSAQPLAFLASAYGVNSMLFTGSYLGTRAVLLSLLERSSPLEYATSTLIASAASGAAIGGAFTGVVSGRRQAIPGALLWAGLCGSSQWALNSLADWRAEKAAEVAGRRRLWAGMSPQQRAEFQAFAASIPSLGPSSTIEGRPVHDFAIHDAGDPPSAKYSAALRTFAASRGLEQRPQAGAGAGNADSAAQDAVAGSEAAARPWHAWLPIHVGSAGSAEEVRLAKLQQRLQHVEELLGAGRSEPGQPGEQGVAGGALSPPPRVLQ